MDILLSSMKSFLSDEIKNKINDKLNDYSILKKFDVGISLEYLDISKLKDEEILREWDKTKFLAQISLDLWCNYEHSKLIRFENLYDDDEFNDRMVKLGLALDNNLWKSVRRPEIYEVHMNIFLYCICETLYNKMEFNNTNLQNTQNEQFEILMKSNENGANSVIMDSTFIQPSLLELSPQDTQPYCHILNDGSGDIHKGKKEEDAKEVQCRFCDTFNSLDKTKCKICEEELSLSSNTVPQMINNDEREEKKNNKVKETELISSYYNRVDDKSLRQETLKQNLWECSSCTFNNPIEEWSCSVCLNERVKKKEEVSPQSLRVINKDVVTENDDLLRTKETLINKDNKDSKVFLERCEYLNKGSLESKKSVESRGVLTCGNCTCDNDGTNGSCMACNTYRGGDTARKKEDDIKEMKKDVLKNVNLSIKSTLEPENDTLNQEKKRDITESSFVKDGRKDLVEQSINKWSCTFCTFLNEETTLNCGACDRGSEFLKQGLIQGHHNDGRSKSSKSRRNKRNNNKVPKNVEPNCNSLRSLQSKNTEIKLNKEVNLSFNYIFLRSSATRSAHLISESEEHFTDTDTEDNITEVDNVMVRSSGETWACPSCTFNNKLENKCCEVCFTLREVEESPENKTEDKGDSERYIELEEVRKETWKCTPCRKENSFDRYICKNCRKYAPFFQKWVCERCSFFNDEMSECCNVCDVKNVNLKKCNKCKTRIKKSEGDFCNYCKENSSRTKEIVNEENDRKTAEYKKSKSKVTFDWEDFCKNKYYCNNRWCGAIYNNKQKHCAKCKLKKEANVTFLNTVDVYNGNTYIKMWQCTFCGDFNAKAPCGKCKNKRHTPSYKKCSHCNWVNKSNDKSCSKCFKILSKEERE